MSGTTEFAICLIPILLIGIGFILFAGFDYVGSAIKNKRGEK